MMSFVLAQVRPRGTGVEYAREWFGRSDPTFFKQILLFLCLLGLGVLAAWVLSKLQQKLKDPTIHAKPMRLFLRMQSKLGLPLMDRWRLWRLARSLQMRHPTAMLISPACFDEAVTRYTGGKDQRRRPQIPQVFMTIRSRLFRA